MPGERCLALAGHLVETPKALKEEEAKDGSDDGGAGENYHLSRQVQRCHAQDLGCLTQLNSLQLDTKSYSLKLSGTIWHG